MAYQVNVFFNCDECGEKSAGIEPKYEWTNLEQVYGQYLTTHRDLERLANRNGFTIDDDCAFCDDCAPKKGL